MCLFHIQVFPLALLRFFVCIQLALSLIEIFLAGIIEQHGCIYSTKDEDTCCHCAESVYYLEYHELL